MGIMIDSARFAELGSSKNSEPILDFLQDPKSEAKANQTLEAAKKQIGDSREKNPKGVFNLDKDIASFAPMGPFLVTPDQAGNADNLGMELRVNGQTRQFSSTKNMVFKMRQLVEFFSSMTLEPGDIITSGTPSGVAIYRQ